jgi:hypothetical protein
MRIFLIVIVRWRPKIHFFFATLLAKLAQIKVVFVCECFTRLFSDLTMNKIRFLLKKTVLKIVLKFLSFKNGFENISLTFRKRAFKN